MNKKQLIVAWVVALLLLTGCATVYNPATGRQDEVSAFIKPAIETLLAYYFYIDVCRTYGSGYQDARLNNIGRKVAAVSDRRRDFKYHFVALNSSVPQALTASGGYIYVTKGLMAMATDDELASIIAHELGHDACRHMVKRIPALIGIYAFNRLISKKDDNKDIQKIVAAMYKIISSGYSRQDEREADKLAVRYAKRSGYNPEAFITFFQKMQNLERAYGVSSNPILASHPPTSERIRNARAEIASLASSSRYAYNNSADTSRSLAKKRKDKMSFAAHSPPSGGDKWSRLRLNMTESQVKDILGKPVSTNSSNAKTVIWIYKDKASATFLKDTRGQYKLYYYTPWGSIENEGRSKMALPASSPKPALSVKDGKLKLPKKALSIAR